MNTKSQKWLYVLFFSLIFAFLYIWFSEVHALVVYDADDWTYLAYIRRATPIKGEWNPAKVFPEVVFPFFSTVAAYVLVPLTGDYITAQTMMHAFVVSAFITGYLWSVFCLLRRSFQISRSTDCVLTVLFLAFHFWAMRGEDTDNSYLLYCIDLNCYYNYLLPELLNASLVMWLMHNEHIQPFLKNGEPIRKGIFYLILYLAIFSNLPASGILAAYAGCQILLGMVRCLMQRSWKGFLRSYALYEGILGAWLVSAIYEAGGGRAGTAAGYGILYGIYVSCRELFFAVWGCNKVFFALAIAIILLAVIVLLRRGVQNPTEKRLCTLGITLLISLAAYSIYEVLLCAVVDPFNMLRSEYLFGMFFFGMMLVMLALAYLLECCPAASVVLPLAAVVLISSIDTRFPTFRESNYSALPSSVCADVSRDLIAQLQEADRQGLKETVLYVPTHVSDPETEDNWPHSLYLSERISTTLYNHGILRRPIQITVVADPAKNEQFHIPSP